MRTLGHYNISDIDCMQPKSTMNLFRFLNETNIERGVSVVN